MQASKGKLLMAMGMILVIFGIFSPFALSLTGGQIYVTVNSDTGVPISGATVTLVSVNWIQAGLPPMTIPLNIVGTTDAQGKTSFGSSIDGTYTITASKEGFETGTKIPTVTGGVVKTVIFSLVGDSTGTEDPPAPILPEGHWNIDKYQDVGEDDIIYIPWEQLPMEYVCTANADKITGVSAKVYDVDRNLLHATDFTQQDGTRWGAIIDLPGEGVYIVEGYVSTSTGSLRTLTIFGGEETGDLFGDNRSNLFVYGGIALFVAGMYVEKRSEGDE